MTGPVLSKLLQYLYTGVVEVPEALQPDVAVCVSGDVADLGCRRHGPVGCRRPAGPHGAQGAADSGLACLSRTFPPRLQDFCTHHVKGFVTAPPVSPRSSARKRTTYEVPPWAGTPQVAHHTPHHSPKLIWGGDRHMPRASSSALPGMSTMGW